MCASGKKTFATKRAAARARNQRLYHGPRRNRPGYLRVYHCPGCNQWHLTRRKTREEEELVVVD